MRYWMPQHFRVQELVPQSIYQEKGDGALIAMDSRIVWTLDALRGYFGVPITVNNWADGGTFDQRGYRTDAAMLAKTPLSQHRFGRAVDFDIQGVDSETFRGLVRQGKLDTQLGYITRIEDGVPWVHIDCASAPGSEIVFFKA